MAKTNEVQTHAIMWESNDWIISEQDEITQNRIAFDLKRQNTVFWGNKNYTLYVKRFIASEVETVNLDTEFFFSHVFKITQVLHTVNNGNITLERAIVGVVKSENIAYLLTRSNKVYKLATQTRNGQDESTKESAHSAIMKATRLAQAYRKDYNSKPENAETLLPETSFYNGTKAKATKAPLTGFKLVLTDSPESS